MVDRMVSRAARRALASPAASAVAMAAAAAVTLAAVAESAAKAFSNALKGSAEDAGTLPKDASAGETPSLASEDDLPPTTPSAYLSGVTTQSAVSALGVSVSLGAAAGAAAAEDAAAGPSSDSETLISSPTTSILTPWPALATRASQPAGSGMAARSTPVCLARIAMCDSKSTGAEVSTAVTPGGMSSRPPKRAERITTGAAE